MKNKLPRFRDALTFSVLLLILPAAYPAQEAGRHQHSPPTPQAERLIDVEAQLEPQLPCGRDSIPSYPGLNDSANVKSWSQSDFDWKPPVCTGWAEVGFTTLMTIAARFPHTSETGGLLRHIGAISDLAGMRYWSTTRKQWRTLIVDVFALTGSQSGQHREDFSSDEMKEGKVLYFEQVDNLSGKAIYRMHIVEAPRLASLLRLLRARSCLSTVFPRPATDEESAHHPARKRVSWRNIAITLIDPGGAVNDHFWCGAAGLVLRRSSWE